jgi:hypothetical protein
MPPFNIKEELSKLQSIGFSRSEAIENLLAKGINRQVIDRVIDIYYKPVKDLRRRSSFLFTTFLLIVISSTPLIGVFVPDGDISWLFVTVFLLAITVGFYRLWNFSLWAWSILLGLILAFLFYFLLYIFTHRNIDPTNVTSATWKVIGLMAFTSMMLRNVTDVLRQRRKFLSSKKGEFDT